MRVLHIIMALVLGGAPVSVALAQRLAYGDHDGDGDVDLDDFAEVPACMGGPGGGLGPGCEVFDFDASEDMDLSDAAAFQRVFGPLAPPEIVPIPGGEFAMGCHAETGETCFADLLPVHDVYVDSFYMDVYEVTNEHYAAFLNAAYSQGLMGRQKGRASDRDRSGGSSDALAESFVTEQFGGGWTSALASTSDPLT